MPYYNSRLHTPQIPLEGERSRLRLPADAGRMCGAGQYMLALHPQGLDARAFVSPEAAQAVVDRPDAGASDAPAQHTAHLQAHIMNASSLWPRPGRRDSIQRSFECNVGVAVSSTVLLTVHMPLSHVS